MLERRLLSYKNRFFVGWLKILDFSLNSGYIINNPLPIITDLSLVNI